MSQAQITLNVSPVDTGTVNIAGVTEIDYRQNCRDSCVTYSATDTQGGSATFTASPDTGYQFLGWTVDGSPQGSNLVLVLGPYPSVIPPTTLTATFETIPQNTDSDNDGVYDDADDSAGAKSAALDTAAIAGIAGVSLLCFVGSILACICFQPCSN